MFFFNESMKTIQPNPRAYDKKWRRYSTSFTTTSCVQGCDMLVDNLGFWFTKILHYILHIVIVLTRFMSQPHFGQVWGWSPTLGKVGGLESSGTPECSELDSKAQNTLHWGVLGVIGKVLKLRYRKWPYIGNSDIFSPSYGQKKGQESN
jgi:hypothetical protein